MSKSHQSFAKRAFDSKFSLPVIGVLALIIGYGMVNMLAYKNNVAGSPNCKGVCVSIKPEGMDPTELAVKVGEYVQFNTADNKTHNLSLGNGQDAEHGQHDALAHDHNAGFESGKFGPGEAYRVQFKKAGTYVMHDHDYPTNRILIVVYNPSK